MSPLYCIVFDWSLFAHVTLAIDRLRMNLSLCLLFYYYENQLKISRTLITLVVGSVCTNLALPPLRSYKLDGNAVAAAVVVVVVLVGRSSAGLYPAASRWVPISKHPGDDDASRSSASSCFHFSGSARAAFNLSLGKPAVSEFEAERKSTANPCASSNVLHQHTNKPHIS